MGGEGAKEIRKQLVLEIGNVQEIKRDPMSEVLDRQALADLKNSILRQKR